MQIIPEQSMSSARQRNKTFSGNYGKRAAYCREKDLPRLTGLWPREINAVDIKSRERIIAILRNALRLERQRGKSGHWCYDINRHLALKRALTQEVIALKAITDSGKRRRRFDDRRAEVPHEPSSHPALFLALPTASSS
jgi:hypothetical protein